MHLKKKIITIQYYYLQYVYTTFYYICIKFNTIFKIHHRIKKKKKSLARPSSNFLLPYALEEEIFVYWRKKVSLLSKAAVWENCPTIIYPQKTWFVDSVDVKTCINCKNIISKKIQEQLFSLLWTEIIRKKNSWFGNVLFLAMSYSGALCAVIVHLLYDKALSLQQVLFWTVGPSSLI